MALNAIETVSLKEGDPAFPRKQDIGDLTTTHWVVIREASFRRESTSIAFRPRIAERDLEQ